MKLNRKKRNVERMGVQAETQFTIKTTAQAFEILSSGMYSDKILAVIRELSCNAYDAHVDAEKADVPFTIHLPNNLEPWFAVKDDGVGLSDADVMGLYTSYFDSTKDKSDDYIGAFGLGSKSPFSYTNTFDVTSRFNGIKRVYNIFINEEGVPTISRMMEAKTDECNGLEVKLTVRPADFRDFKLKAQSALKYFPTKPKVVGDPYFQFEKLPKSAIEGNGWVAYRRSGGYYAYTMTAVQGNVPYKVDINQLNLSDKEFRFVRGTELALFFDIGELDIAASREELQYTERTMDAVRKKVQTVVKDIHKILDKRVQKLDGKVTYWEACAKIREITKTLFDNQNVFLYVKPDDVKSPFLKRYLETRGKINLTDVLNYHGMKRYSTSYSGRGMSRRDVSIIEPSENHVIFVNDLRIGGIKRLQHWLENSKHSYALVISERKEVVKQKKPAESTLKKEIRKIKKELGGPKIHYTSKDTKPVKTTRKKGKRIKFIFRHRRSNSNRSRDQWERLEIDNDVDMSKGGFYIHLYKGTNVLDANERNMRWHYDPNVLESNMKDMCKLLNQHVKELGIKKQPCVYGIPTLSMGEMKKHADKWHDAIELTKKFANKHSSALEHKHRWAATIDSLGIKLILDEKWFGALLDELDDDSTFKKTLLPARKAVLEHKEHDFSDLVRQFVKQPAKNPKPYYNTGTILDKYPMLIFASSNGYIGHDQRKWKRIFDYVKLIDQEDQT